MSEQPTGWSRRRFLGGLAVVGAALVPGVVPQLRRAQATQRDAAAERLVALFADGRGPVVELGRAYLDQRPDEPSPAVLVAELTPPTAAAEWPLGVADDQLRDAVATASAADLRGGRVELVGSWLLSATDARLAALVSLAAQPA